MSYTLIRMTSCFCVLGLIAAGLCLDLSASAGSLSQNANSSTTMPQEPSTTNKAEMVAAAPAEEIDLSGTWS